MSDHRPSRVFVRVRMTVEIAHEQPWSGSETVDNVRRFAEKEAREKLALYCQPVKGLRLVSVDASDMHILEERR